MPIIDCKENEGLQNSCKKKIVYLGENITSLSGGKLSVDKATQKGSGGDEVPKKKYLTLKCIDGHIHNYEIIQ